MGIDSISFLKATNPKIYEQYSGLKQAPSFNGEVPTTTSRIQTGYKPSTEDYEMAQAFIDGNYKTSNPFIQPTKRTQEITKPGWEGYKLPPNNGNGELKPVITGREDSIIDLDLTA